MKRYIRSSTVRWQDLLSEDVLDRLKECKSSRSDIVPIAQAIYTEKNGTIDKDESVTLALEHLASNNQLFNYTNADYERAVKRIH